MDQRPISSELGALVLPRATNHLPSRRLPIKDLDPFLKLKCADPLFYRPGRIDMILGVDVHSVIMRSGVKRVGKPQLLAQRTELGWIFSGCIKHCPNPKSSKPPFIPRMVSHCVVNDNLDELLKKFWNVEEVPSLNSSLTPDEEQCESLYRSTTVRDNSGRYVVRLPLRGEPPPVAAQTKGLALSSYYSLMRRFDRDPWLSEQYRLFMQQYIDLGHMALIPDGEIKTERAWYLPHHPVIQKGLTQRKLRVVFDASRRTAERLCLNDFLLPGPSLQTDLSLILTNWREFRFVFTSDVIKMFRQVAVAEADRDFQRILWSPDPGQPPRDYRLSTVTYGTASAPFLAIRTLQQLAHDEKTHFPLGARCLLDQIYVDDIFTDSNEISEAKLIRDQLVAILRSAGIGLDKWAANTPELLDKFETVTQGINNDKPIQEDETVKVLGLLWHPSTHSFRFNVGGLSAECKEISKRTILSNLARLFDPLGWLSPVVVKAKILMQDLWILKVDWDSPLSFDITKRWTDYCYSLEGVPEIEVPRWLGPFRPVQCELHGFADSSMRAYAAAIYLRSIDQDGNCRVALLMAKSKVSPVKTLSIPRLELCGAVLLVKLLRHLRKSETYKDCRVTCWSDSRDALSWIRKHPSSWKVFIANRVSYIQTELPSAIWKYVSTHDNPADLATRGVDSSVLRRSTLWWHGPEWLMRPVHDWPKQPDGVMPDDPPVRVHAVIQEEHDEPFIERVSTLARLVKIAAIGLRFRRNCMHVKKGQERETGFLTARELDTARTRLISVAQSSAFPMELRCLRQNLPLVRHSPLLRLNPFLDQNGIIRVGGRLTHSALPFPAKHPPILPKEAHLSKLFIQQAHLMALHGGPTLTLGHLHQHAWVLGSVGSVKRHVRTCVVCNRAKPRKCRQMMGDLPPERVTPSGAFAVTGLDYAGPFKVRISRGRGQRYDKGYIAIFVCFATKAIHLEAVGDLTTDKFLAALRRFKSRRTACNKLFSDNGTNFRGADKELRNMFNRSSAFYNEIAKDLAEKQLSWEFILPSSPHFGGLWEAGVRSTKHHLLRVLGDHPLIFEEFTTVLCEIEACLNSRPLYPMTGDIDDLDILTPAHFLSGGSTGLLPDAPIPKIPENRLDRFQLLSRMQQSFWKRWSREYLHHLQERHKWRGPNENFKVGQLVIVHDDRYPTARWPLGRVIEVHPGKDGLVRVVTIKTSTTTLKRPIVKLSPLPLPPEHSSQSSKAGGIGAN